MEGRRPAFFLSATKAKTRPGATTTGWGTGVRLDPASRFHLAPSRATGDQTPMGLRAEGPSPAPKIKPDDNQNIHNPTIKTITRLFE
jgi:hypothetical protein